MPKTEEYKDKKGKHRIRHTADNGNVTHASTQGYHNLQDVKDSTVNAAVQILKHYKDEITPAQSDELRSIL